MNSLCQESITLLPVYRPLLPQEKSEKWALIRFFLRGQGGGLGTQASDG